MNDNPFIFHFYHSGRKITRLFFEDCNSCMWWRRKVFNIIMIQTFSSLLGVRMVLWTSPYLNILCTNAVET